MAIKGSKIIEREDVRALLPKRRRDSHKGNYGRAAIVAGSIEYTGAAYLSAAACLRSGVGYTALFIPQEILPFYALKSPEILLRNTNEGSRYAFNEENMRGLLGYDSIAFGMGMGVSEDVYKGVEYLLSRYTGRLILDADSLNSLACYGVETLLPKKTCDVILTPHVKEFSRLSGLSVEEIIQNSEGTAQAFARKYGVSVLLKNASSVITDGERIAINERGNSGQAKGGSGDVLSGVIAGLCGSGLSAFDGGVCAAYLVGKAAELGALDIGEYSLTASDLIAYMGKAFLYVTENTDKNSGKQ